MDEPRIRVRDRSRSRSRSPAKRLRVDAGNERGWRGSRSPVSARPRRGPAPPFKVTPAQEQAYKYFERQKANSAFQDRYHPERVLQSMRTAREVAEVAARQFYIDLQEGSLLLPERRDRQKEAAARRAAAKVGKGREKKDGAKNGTKDGAKDSAKDGAKSKAVGAEGGADGDAGADGDGAGEGGVEGGVEESSRKVEGEGEGEGEGGSAPSAAEQGSTVAEKEGEMEVDAGAAPAATALPTDASRPRDDGEVTELSVVEAQRVLSSREEIPARYGFRIDPLPSSILGPSMSVLISALAPAGIERGSFTGVYLADPLPGTVFKCRAWATYSLEASAHAAATKVKTLPQFSELVRPPPVEGGVPPQLLPRLPKQPPAAKVLPEVDRVLKAISERMQLPPSSTASLLSSSPLPWPSPPSLTIDAKLHAALFYLRRVHRFDFQSGSQFASPAELTAATGELCVAALPIAEEVKGDPLAIAAARCAAHVSYLDSLTAADEATAADVNAAADKFYADNCVREDQGKFRCPLSGKLFRGPAFVRKHIDNKHANAINAVKAKEYEAKFWRYFLADDARRDAVDALPPPPRLKLPPPQLPPEQREPPPREALRPPETGRDSFGRDLRPPPRDAFGRDVPFGRRDTPGGPPIGAAPFMYGHAGGFVPPPGGPYGYVHGGHMVAAGMGGYVPGAAGYMPAAPGYVCAGAPGVFVGGVCAGAGANAPGFGGKGGRRSAEPRDLRSEMKDLRSEIRGVKRSSSKPPEGAVLIDRPVVQYRDLDAPDDDDLFN